MYQLVPEGVVRPRTTEEVVEVVVEAAAAGVPVHARGSGSGRTGGAIGKGVVVDFSEMTEVYLESDVAVVQPGVVLDRLNQFLAPRGRMFGPDPSSSAFCTIGGMIGNNASGPHTLKYGATCDNVIDLEVVFADGTVERLSSRSTRASRVARLLDEFVPMFSEIPDTEKRSTGYDVLGAWNHGDVRMTRLLAGSEGTLGLVTRAWLRTVPVPAVTATAALFFSDLREACAAVAVLKQFELSACELMDEVLLNLVRQGDPEAARPVPDQAQAMLILEADGRDAEAILKSAAEAMRNSRAFLHGESAVDPQRRATLWRIRKASSPLLDRIPGTEVLHAVEDVCVPIDRLPDFVEGQKKIFADLELPAAFFGHAGNGNLHLDPYCDTKRSDLRELLREVMNRTYRWVLECDGVISGEHGDGIVRTPYVKEQYPQLHLAFAKLKSLLDPHGVLNPGKVTAEAAGVPDLGHLRWFEERLAPEPPWQRLRHS